MQSPSKNQTILRNTPKVQQQSGPIAITQPKSQVQQSYAPATEVMEVIAVSDVYVDGSPVVHGGIVICKKTLDICSSDDCGKTFENISICLPDVDGTSGISFQPIEIEKIFMYPKKRIIGFLFNPKCEHKSIILDMTVVFRQDDFTYFKDTFLQMFVNIVSSVTTLRNQKEAKKYVTSNFPGGIEVWRMAFGKKERPLRLWGINPFHPTFEFFRPYFRCYTNVVRKNPLKTLCTNRVVEIIGLANSLFLGSGLFLLLNYILILNFRCGTNSKISIFWLIWASFESFLSVLSHFKTPSPHTLNFLIL